MLRRLILAALILAIPMAAQAADCTSTKPAVGVPCTDPNYGTTITRLTDWAGQGLAVRLYNDYSRKQGYNSDNSLAVAEAGNGFWWLFNATTSAPIRQMTGPTGDTEWQWSATDPHKAWYMTNGGSLLLKEYNTVDDTSTTAADFTARVQALWPLATKCWTKAEGSPSKDDRYWAFRCNNGAGSATYGVFSWDKQTDTILGSLTLTDPTKQPDNVSMSPSGRYVVIMWSNTQYPFADGVRGRTRAYTRDFSDWTYVDCSTNHIDLVEGLDGHDYFVGAYYVTDTCGAAQPNGFGGSSNGGPVVFRDIDAGWTSHGFDSVQIITGLKLYDPAGTTRAIHFSGRAFSKPGWAIVSTYKVVPLQNQDYANDHRIGRLKIAAGANPIYFADTYNCHLDYRTEPHASISRDGAQVLWTSNWDRWGGACTGDADTDVYTLSMDWDIPPDLDISTTTLPDGQVGVAYSQQIDASGGVPAYTFSKTLGDYPTGTTMSGAGVLAGTPTVAGTYTFTVRVTDTQPLTADRELSVIIRPAALTLTTATLGSGVVLDPYYATLASSGGTAPYTYSEVTSSGCTGLTLSAAGVISGAPTIVGTCSLTARVTDDAAATDDQDLTIEVVSGPLTGSVQAGSTTAIIRFGGPGLPYAQSCNVTVTAAEDEVFNDDVATGAATRMLPITGLTAATEHVATVTCTGWTNSSYVTTFMTQAAGATASYGFTTRLPNIIKSRAIALDGSINTLGLVLSYSSNGGALHEPVVVYGGPLGTGECNTTTQVCALTVSLPSGNSTYYWSWVRLLTTTPISTWGTTAHRPSYVAIP